MDYSRAQFQAWGKVGGRMAAARLTKAQRRARAKKAAAAREANKAKRNGK